jgi:hypothetical protein
MTLPDEVSHVTGVSPAKFIVPLVKDQIRLVWEEIMGYAGRILVRHLLTVP